MTIRKYLAKIILALWCSTGILVAAAGSQTGLTPLVRAFRQSPVPARRAAVESYAASHPKEAPLAHLALGVAAYEQKDYPTAIANLKKAAVPEIADYAAYYLAAARVEASDPAGIPADLAPVHATELPSPLAGKSWLVESRALQEAEPAQAVRILRDHYAALPQPDGDLALADAYQAAGDQAHAADFYQRVYYEYVSGDASTTAAAALAALKDAMGSAYPQPLATQELRRATRLLEARQYAAARAEFLVLVDRLVGLEREQARVRVGAADLLAGRTAPALAYLQTLEMAPSEADAERLYYVEESARRLKDDAAMNAAVATLAHHYGKSPWRLKALAGAASRYLLINRPDDFVPLYKAAYENFPDDTAAPLYHWKVAFQAYLHNQSDAGDLLREHLRNYPLHTTAGAALYFLARHAEQHNDAAAARAYYERLASGYPNQFYAMLARDRLRQPAIAAAAPSEDAEQFLRRLKQTQPAPPPSEPTRPTTLRIERSRLLRSAGLGDLADAELRFGARTDGQPQLLALEIAEGADAPYVGLRAMKALGGDYLSLPVEQAPRRYWEALFPLPYRGELETDARRQGVDPFLLAGLIRQESEFNPGALSSANAYGLTQVRPGTAREVARRVGIQRFRARQLFEPGPSLKIGSAILRSMIDQYGGKLEQTLAAYNAGPARVAEWVTWGNWREPAEFIESIPFTETRDYVQAVLRNADMYRRLYRPLP
jgi:soluble lytic murein transglycosylase